jgi:hypothetical protein
LTLVLLREKPRGVVVILDNSQSMKQQDRRLSGADKLRVALAKGLVPLQTVVDDGKTPLPSNTPQDPARAELVRGILAHPDLKLLQRLEKYGPVRTYLLGGDLRGIDEQGTSLVGSFTADEPRTALAEGVLKVLQNKEGELPSAIVVITDGQDNASKYTFNQQEALQEAAVECARYNVPLHVYGVGTAEGGSLQLKEVGAPETIFVEDTITVPLRWRAQGFKKGTVVINLTLGGKQIASKEVAVQTGEDLREALAFIVPKGGEKEETLDLVTTIQVKGNDVFKDRLVRTVRVVDRKIKVLVIENAPRWEYKFLQPALLRDRRIEAQFILVNADPKVARGGPPFLPEFPKTREEFFDARYNLIILGDVPASYLGKEHQEWIREFVQNRGGLIVIAGRQNLPSGYEDSPLAEVLPVEFTKQKFGIDSDVRTQEYPPTLTEAGNRSGMLALADTPEENDEAWRKLSGFHWFYPVTKLRPAATPLIVNPRAKMGEQPMPILASQFYGKGQVLFLATDETWRWRWNNQDKVFVRFWGQLIYQAGLPSMLGDSARRVQVALEKSQATLGEPGSVFVRLLDKDYGPRKDPQVEATLEYTDAKPGQEKSRRVLLQAVPGRPGEYRTLLTHDQPGRYELKVANPDLNTFSFLVDLPPRHELEEAGMNEKGLRHMAQLSGGAFYREEDLYRLADALERKTTTYRDRQELLLYPLALALFIGLVTSEWLVRKFSNLS